MVRKVAPSLPDTGAPDHTPENVGRFFEQGMENLPRNFDAAGTMFRKALDTALAARFPELKGRLVERIDKAASNGALTRDMAEWAHRIRRLGNDAAHDEEPFSQSDVPELHGLPSPFRKCWNSAGPKMSSSSAHLLREKIEKSSSSRRSGPEPVPHHPPTGALSTWPFFDNFTPSIARLHRFSSCATCLRCLECWR